MAKLMKSKVWAAREFVTGSEPSPGTIKKWVEEGVIAGRIIGRTTYVFDTEKAGVESHIAAAVSQLLRE